MRLLCQPRHLPRSAIVLLDSLSTAFFTFTPLLYVVHRNCFPATAETGISLRAYEIPTQQYCELTRVLASDRRLVANGGHPRAAVARALSLVQVDLEATNAGTHSVTVIELIHLQQNRTNTAPK